MAFSIVHGEFEIRKWMGLLRTSSRKECVAEDRESMFRFIPSDYKIGKNTSKYLGPHIGSF
jgi:hypothetical protein